MAENYNWIHEDCPNKFRAILDNGRLKQIKGNAPLEKYPKQIAITDGDIRTLTPYEESEQLNHGLKIFIFTSKSGFCREYRITHCPSCGVDLSTIS